MSFTYFKKQKKEKEMSGAGGGTLDSFSKRVFQSVRRLNSADLTHK